MQTDKRLAIVTGAAGKGIGRSVSLTLAREGMAVVVNYVHSGDAAQGIVDHIRAEGGDAVAVRADIFTSGGCQHLAEATREQFGRVDILVIGPGAGFHAEPVDSLAVEDAIDDIHQEIAPLYHLMPLVLPEMYQRGWGRLIGIAVNLDLPSPSYAYNVAKTARQQALLQAGPQAWPHGVTVNVIAPAPVPVIESLDEAVELCDHGPAWLDRTTTSPQDIAEGVAYLCSEAGRFVTGCVLSFSFRP